MRTGWLSFVVFFGALRVIVTAEPVQVRIVAANLTSGTQQSYSPDNGNHSNAEGAGARILKALKPDIVLIQEFNTSVPTAQWVAATFGSQYQFAKESGTGLPNGVISRYPIVAQGEWDDPTQSNRDFAWAKMRLPNGRILWAVSVHLYAQKPAVRQAEAAVLVERIRANIPAADYVVLGGDFNTGNRQEACVQTLSAVFNTGAVQPVDQGSDGDTNANRNKPYDWVLADAELQPTSVASVVGGQTFAHGLIFDSRRFQPLTGTPPTQVTDSGALNMQHMAVVRDFRVP